MEKGASVGFQIDLRHLSVLMSIRTRREQRVLETRQNWKQISEKAFMCNIRALSSRINYSIKRLCYGNIITCWLKFLGFPGWEKTTAELNCQRVRIFFA